MDLTLTDDSRERMSNLEPEESLRLARQVVLNRAPGVLNQLADKAGGNYLAVRFLLEFAGLLGQPDSEKRASPALQALLEEMKRIEDSDGAEQTSPAKMNLYSDCSHNSISSSHKPD